MYVSDAYVSDATAQEELEARIKLTHGRNAKEFARDAMQRQGAQDTSISAAAVKLTGGTFFVCTQEAMIVDAKDNDSYALTQLADSQGPKKGKDARVGAFGIGSARRGVDHLQSLALHARRQGFQIGVEKYNAF